MQKPTKPEESSEAAPQSSSPSLGPAIVETQSTSKGLNSSTECPDLLKESTPSSIPTAESQTSKPTGSKGSKTPGQDEIPVKLPVLPGGFRWEVSRETVRNTEVTRLEIQHYKKMQARNPHHRSLNYLERLAGVEEIPRYLHVMAWGTARGMMVLPYNPPPDESTPPLPWLDFVQQSAQSMYEDLMEGIGTEERFDMLTLCADYANGQAR